MGNRNVSDSVGADGVNLNRAFVEGAGFGLRAKVVSPIAGGDGNVETVLVFGRG